MSIALRGYSKTNNSHSSATSVATSYTGWQTSNPAVGDMIVAILVVTASGETITQSGTGSWTILSSDSNAAANAPFTSCAAYRLYASGDTAPTFNWGTGAAWAYILTALYETTGLQVAFDASATVTIDTASSTTHTPGAATAATASDLSLILNAARAQATGAGAITMTTPSSGYTAVTIGGYAGATGFYADSTSGYYEVPVGSGTVTPGVETFAVSVACNAYQLLFQAITGAAPAGLASGTGTSQPPVPAIIVNAALAAGTGAALRATAGLIGAQLATGTGTALQPTVIRGTSGTKRQAALPGIALPCAALPDNPGAGVAAPTGTADAGVTSAFATGLGPVPAVIANAVLATGTGAALTPFAGPPGVVPAQIATATGTALQPVVVIPGTAAAGLATAIGAALQPAISASAPPPVPGQTRRIHGRSGVVYLGITAGAQASPVAFLSGWEIDFTGNPVDTTVLTDMQHRSTATVPTVSGTFQGFYDTSTAQTYAAAVDGQPRNMYLYPSTGNPAQFFSGKVLADYSVSGSVGGAVQLTVTWNAAGPVTASPAI